MVGAACLALPFAMRTEKRHTYVLCDNNTVADAKLLDTDRPATYCNNMIAPTNNQKVLIANKQQKRQHLSFSLPFLSLSFICVKLGAAFIIHMPYTGSEVLGCWEVPKKAALVPLSTYLLLSYFHSSGEKTVVATNKLLEDNRQAR